MEELIGFFAEAAEALNSIEGNPFAWLGGSYKGTSFPSNGTRKEDTKRPRGDFTEIGSFLNPFKAVPAFINLLKEKFNSSFPSIGNSFGFAGTGRQLSKYSVVEDSKKNRTLFRDNEPIATYRENNEVIVHSKQAGDIMSLVENHQRTSQHPMDIRLPKNSVAGAMLYLEALRNGIKVEGNIPPDPKTLDAAYKKLAAHYRKGGQKAIPNELTVALNHAKQPITELEKQARTNSTVQTRTQTSQQNATLAQANPKLNINQLKNFILVKPYQTAPYEQKELISKCGKDMVFTIEGMDEQAGTVTLSPHPHYAGSNFSKINKNLFPVTVKMNPGLVKDGMISVNFKNKTVESGNTVSQQIGRSLSQSQSGGRGGIK